jgi:hypothetical protein
MPVEIGRSLCWAIDAVSFAEDRLNFIPDPWQRQLLRSRSSWLLLNCCRQSGKSTTTAIVALHTAIYEPGIVLCVSPSLRQSKELFAKVIAFLKSIEPVIPLEEDNKSSCELSNGSRIVSLPGDPDTVRGYSAPRLVITDEAAYIPDAMAAAILPMLATGGGRRIDMSSPNGRRGYFYESWQYGENAERIKITGEQCPRIGAKYLTQMKRELGPMLYSQEFEGEFIDDSATAFNSELIEAALVDELSPWPRLAA